MYFRIFKIFLTGLLTSQFISFIHVYYSNYLFYNKLDAIHKAGYLVIPNLYVMAGLKGFKSAFFGGLFFTLTIGMALCLLGIFFALIWDRIFLRKKVFLFSPFAFWITCLILINLKGFSPLITIHFLFIPVISFMVCLKWLPKPSNNKTKIKFIIHVICLLSLLITGSLRLNTASFSMIRDNFLLSTNFGIILNNLYYDYTLYAAQVFKSLNQDMLRTCRLSPNLPETQKLKKKLMRYDYLTVNNTDNVDLNIIWKNEKLVFIHNQKEILITTKDEFYKNTGKILKQFSQKCDKYGFFRYFTFLSLLIVLSLSFYLILYIPCCFISGIFFKEIFACLLAAFLCFMAGTAFFISLHPEKFEKMNKAELKSALISDNVNKRLTALKYIRRKGLEIADFTKIDKIAQSPYVAERYWLAKTLIVSRSPLTYETNLALLDDIQLNVSYIAFGALGKRKDRQAVGEILKRIKKSKDWYVQFYAYKALRRLGWRQTGLQ